MGFKRTQVFPPVVPTPRWTSPSSRLTRCVPARRGEAVLACMSYASCSTLLTLANKAIFSEHKMNYPWMLLGVQSIVVMLLLLIFYSTDSTQTLVNRTLLRQMAFPCTFFTSFIFTNARALRYISLPILTVIKSLAPMGVALAERILFKERVSAGTYGAMGLIVFGNGVTAMHDVEFDATGYTWAFINVAMNIAYVVSLRYCLSNSFSSGQKTLHSNILACVLIFPLAFIAGEPVGFVYELGKTTTKFRILFIISCVLAAGIGASVFWVIQTASGSTLSFVGAANKVFVVILGTVLFDAKLSVEGWIGVCMGTLAGLLFSLAKAKGNRKRRMNEDAKDGGVEVRVDGLLDKGAHRKTSSE